VVQVLVYGFKVFVPDV